MVIAKTARETADTRGNTHISPFAEHVFSLSMQPLLNTLAIRYNRQGGMIFSIIADRLQAAQNFSNHTFTPTTSQVAEVKSIHAKTIRTDNGTITENLEVRFYNGNYPTGIVTAFTQRREDRPRVEQSIKQVITITPYKEHIESSERETEQNRVYDDRLAFVEFKDGTMRIVRPFREVSGRLTYIAVTIQEGSPEHTMIQALCTQRSNHTESNLRAYLRELVLPSLVI